MTTDDKTTDSTPALLSAARLAEIRERVAAGKFEHTMSDRAAMLAHLAALTPPAAPCDREAGGRLVREIWIAWAREQPSPKPSWLVPWEGLSEPDREVDRRIFEACYATGRAGLAPCEVDGEALGRLLLAQLTAELSPTWAKVMSDVEDEHWNRAALALRAIGYAAGRSEGEAELARMTEKEAIAREMMEKCAEGERRTREAWVDSNERATQEGIDIGRAQGWKEANVEIDRLVKAREDRDATIARLTAGLATAEQLTAAAVETSAADRERALNAESARDAAREEIAISRREAQSACDGMDRLQDKIDALTAELAGARAALAESEAHAGGMLTLCNVLTAERDTARRDGAREEREACALALTTLRNGSDPRADERIIAFDEAIDAIRARGEGQGS